MRKTKHFLLMAATLLCSMGASAHDFAKNGIFYKAPRQIDLADLTVMVTYFDPDNDSGYSTFKNEYKGRVVIPSTVTYEGMTFRVTRIDNYAFCECDALTSVVIPSTIVSIGESAFEDCYNLTSVTIPKSVTRIEESAFSGCKKMNSVTLSEGLESIGYAAFRDCVSLTSIKIPNSVTEFKGSWGYNSTFEGCTNLTSVTLPRGITGIGRDRKTFEGCSKQLKINGVFYYEGIGQQVHNVTPIAPKPVPDFEFKVTANGVVLTKYNNKNKTGSLVLPEDYNGKKYDIGAGVFSGCSSLTSITLPEGVTSIGTSAFSRCSSLTSITIPEGVTSIGNNAFLQCKNLRTITLPSSMRSIGEDAFYGCKNLDVLICKAVTPPTVSGYSTFDDIYRKTLRVPKSSIEAYKSTSPMSWGHFWNIRQLIIAGGACGYDLTWTLYEDGNLIVRGTGAMNEYSSSKVVPWYPYKDAINTVVLSEGVTSISSLVFEGCENLASVNIPYSITSIGEDAFRDCSNLMFITVPITIPRWNKKLLNGAFGDENVKLKVNGKTRTIKPQKTSQNSKRGNLENRIKEWASPSMPTGVGVGRVVGSAVGSVN